MRHFGRPRTLLRRRHWNTWFRRTRSYVARLTALTNIAYTKLLKYCDEHTTLYVAPDSEVAKRCTRLASENERQAEQIATLLAQLSDSASAAGPEILRRVDPGYEMQKQSQVEGTQDLSANKQHLSAAYQAVSKRTEVQVCGAPSTPHVAPHQFSALPFHCCGFSDCLARTQSASHSCSVPSHICPTRLPYTSSCCILTKP